MGDFGCRWVMVASTCVAPEPTPFACDPRRAAGEALSTNCHHTNRCPTAPGADGGATPRFAAYGATKRSLAQLGKSLEAELKLLHVKNVGLHNMSPGMVSGWFGSGLGLGLGLGAHGRALSRMLKLLGETACLHNLSRG